MSKLWVVIKCLAGLSLAGYGAFILLTGDHDPKTADVVEVACREYERLFRDVSGQIATKLERGDLTSDRESRDLRAEVLREALRQAFLPLAMKEAERLDPWSAEEEARMLREYTLKD